MLKEKGVFRQTAEAKYLPNVFLAVPMALVFLILGEVLGALGGSAIFLSIHSGATKSVSLSPEVKLLYALIPSFMATSLLVFAWVKFVERRKISTMGFCKENFVMKFLKGFGIGAAMFAASILLLFITGNIMLDKSPSIPVGMAALSSILIVLPGWIIQSSTEEILTRGWLMNVIGARHNVGLGVGVSSTLFGALHLLNKHVSALAISNIILVGIFFGLYVIKTENLWGACGIHAAWNWAQGNIFGLEVSGNTTGVGSLVKMKLIGSNIITGGEFGPEAGLGVTTILVLAIIVIVYRMRKQYIRVTKLLQQI